MDALNQIECLLDQSTSLALVAIVGGLLSLAALNIVGRFIKPKFGPLAGK